MKEVQIPFHEVDLRDIRKAREARGRLEAIDPSSPDWRPAWVEWTAIAEQLAHMLIFKVEKLDREA
jgi:hypothetical protein